MGIEPTLAAWEAAVLPLNYARMYRVGIRRRGRLSGLPHRRQELIPDEDLSDGRDEHAGARYSGTGMRGPFRLRQFAWQVACDNLGERADLGQTSALPD
jgi:hypothetical protein